MPQELKIAVFIIDDDESTRITIDTIFKSHGINNYTIFSNSKDLLEALYSGVQICVIDYKLSSNDAHDGVSLMKEILKQNTYCKCIVMSGYEDAKLIKMFLNNGAFRYLTKGEKDFYTNLIGYINDALKILRSNFEFYSSVLDRMKEIKELFNELKNEQTTMG